MKASLCVLLALAITVPSNAFTFTRWQVTINELKQTTPVMVGDSVFWRQWYSATLSNIWTQNLLTRVEQPVVERASEKFPTAASGNYLLYNEYEGTLNWYDTGLYNIATGDDQIIASGPENQVAQDIWQNFVIYSVGFTWPDLYLYNISTGETRFIAHEVIRPRIWGDLVVYIKSYGFGYATIECFNLATNEVTQVPSATDHNQTLPDIYKDKVVWSGLNDNLGIFYKNLTTGEERKIADKGSMPVIWGNFIAWNQAASDGSCSILVYDLLSGETNQVSDETSRTGAWEPFGAPYIYENTVLWTSGDANGYGNIFAAKIHPDRFTISGKIILQNFLGNPSTIPITAELRNQDGTITSINLTLKSDGSFTIFDVFSGSYDIAFKASHWLRKTITNLNVCNDISGLSASLINGDVDGNNCINYHDRELIMQAMNKSSDSNCWYMNPDLDGNRRVDCRDLQILLKNYGRRGDR